MIYRQSERSLARVASQKEGAPGFIKLEIAPEQQLFGAGRLFTQITLPPGAVIAEHAHHDEYEVYFILSGEGEYSDNGSTCRLYAGDVAFCRSGESHSLVNTGSEDLTFVAFIGFPNPSKQ